MVITYTVYLIWMMVLSTVNQLWPFMWWKKTINRPPPHHFWRCYEKTIYHRGGCMACCFTHIVLPWREQILHHNNRMVETHPKSEGLKKLTTYQLGISSTIGDFPLKKVIPFGRTHRFLRKPRYGYYDISWLMDAFFDNTDGQKIIKLYYSNIMISINDISWSTIYSSYVLPNIL